MVKRGSCLTDHEVEFIQSIHAIKLFGDFHRVRYDQQRNVLRLAIFFDQVHDLLLIARIDIGGRLVGQQQCWLVGERPCDGDALLFADGQLMRFVMEPVSESDFFQQHVGALR